MVFHQLATEKKDSFCVSDMGPNPYSRSYCEVSDLTPLDF